MLQRRHVLKLCSAALAVPATVASRGMAAAQEGPLFRFGIVADPQYAPVPPKGTRYYANSLWKLSEAVQAFNDQELAFVATLGDIIDRHWESYSHILPVYDRLQHPHHFVLGNHDFEVAGDYLHAVLREVGLERAYYSFRLPGWRFVVIDGNEISLFANPKGSETHATAQARLAAMVERKAVNAQPWNGGMSDTQLAWLEAELGEAEAAGERVVAFGHYPVFPEDMHNMWDYERFLEIVTRSPSFAAFMNGHNHAGNYDVNQGKHFVNFKGMVETPAETAYSVVEVHADRLEIKGVGLEESRALAL